MEPKKEEETTQKVPSLAKDTSANAQPGSQTKPSVPTPQIEEPKSLITKIDNRFKTKVRFFFICLGCDQHKRTKF